MFCSPGKKVINFLDEECIFFSFFFFPLMYFFKRNIPYRNFCLFVELRFTVTDYVQGFVLVDCLKHRNTDGPEMSNKIF